MLEKLVAIMKRKSDVVLMSDCRLGGGVEKVRKIMRMGQGIQYDVYTNSTRSERGVCIAINRARNVEILEEIRDSVTENYLILKCKIDDKNIALGVIYGPNLNNREFYRELIDRVKQLEMPLILGGDYNTVLDGNNGDENIDLYRR